MKKCEINIVVRNNLSGIKKTIKSIIENIDKSNFDFFKIKIVDGYSNDGTWEYIETLENTELNQILEICKLHPRGVYNAMNFCVNNSEVEWIWFINSGDVLISKLGYIKKIIEDIDPSIDAIVGVCGKFYNEKSEKIYHQIKNKKTIRPHQSTIYKRKIHSDCGLYEEQFMGCSDTLFLSQIKEKSIYYENTVLAATLVSPENISRKYKTIKQDYEVNKKLGNKYTLDHALQYRKIIILLFESYIKFSLISYIKTIVFNIFGLYKVKRL